MVEPIMYFAIGFLVSTLLGLTILPLVHNRAARLTTKRLEASTPVSLAEIQADKDLLRAEFAMSSRRLEMTVEQLRTKTTGQLTELGKKSDAVNRLKFELGEKNAAVFALEAREKVFKEGMRATEQEYVQKTLALQTAETELTARNEELARLTQELAERTQLVETRQTELGVANVQIAGLQQRVNNTERDFDDSQQQLAQQREAYGTATRDLEEQRARGAGLEQDLLALQERFDTQTKQIAELTAKLADLENRFAVQGKMLTERGIDNHHLRQQLEDAKAANNEVGLAEKLRTEKAALENELASVRDQSSKLQLDLHALQNTSQAVPDSERIENALLREKISDIAAEVARLAITLEGPDSPIETILSAGADAAMDTPAADLAGSPANDRGSATARSRRATDAAADGARMTLADRIRALQAQAAQAERVGHA